MKRMLAAVALFATLAVAGCATPAADSGKVQAGAAASGTPEARRTITGSRIPENPPRDRLLKSVTNEEWVRDTKSSVIGNQSSGN